MKITFLECIHTRKDQNTQIFLFQFAAVPFYIAIYTRVPRLDKPTCEKNRAPACCSRAHHDLFHTMMSKIWTIRGFSCDVDFLIRLDYSTLKMFCKNATKKSFDYDSY